MKKKGLYYPYASAKTARYIDHQAHIEISQLCKKMIEEKSIVGLEKYEERINELRSKYPRSVEFLELEPEEMIRRYKMGIEAAKVLVIREK